MATRLLFYLDGYDSAPWRDAFLALDPDLDFYSWPNWPAPDPNSPGFALVWQPPHGLLAERADLCAVFSLGAGMDHLLSDPQLPALPLIRMADDGLADGMAEYVLMAVLMLHRRMPHFIAQQKRREFVRAFAPAASDITVSLLGFGRLGQAAARLLAPVGYTLRAWSRTQKTGGEVAHFHGPDGLDACLQGSDIAVGLLPDTPETRHLMTEPRLRLLNPGGGLVNAGRGSLVDAKPLLAVLDSAHLSGAVLDVFEKEPLPADHTFWSHPGVIVTPHVASITRPASAAAYVMGAIQALRTGNTVPHQFEARRGY